MKLPKIGKKAPSFSLINQDEELISLKDFKGKNIVLYFYPKALTPGCTVQAEGIRDYKRKFSASGIVVLAVSPDMPDKLKKFTDKKELNFNLLSDFRHEVAETYGVWGEKQFMGRKYQGVFRVTFIIDKRGYLVHIMEKVQVKTHNQDVLDWIKSNLK